MPLPLIAAQYLAPMAAKSAFAAAMPSGMLGPIVTQPALGESLLGAQGIGGQFVAPEGALPPAPQSAAGGSPTGSAPALPQMAEPPSIDLSRPAGGYTAPTRRRTTIPRLNLP